MTKEELLNVNQVAEIYGVTPRSVRRWIAKGRIAARYTPGGQLRVPVNQMAEGKRKAKSGLSAKGIERHGI